jgi:hypothetical protein
MELWSSPRIPCSEIPVCDLKLPLENGNGKQKSQFFSIPGLLLAVSGNYPKNLLSVCISLP